jgi:hypothetical protein
LLLFRTSERTPHEPGRLFRQVTNHKYDGPDDSREVEEGEERSRVWVQLFGTQVVVDTWKSWTGVIAGRSAMMQADLHLPCVVQSYVGYLRKLRTTMSSDGTMQIQIVSDRHANLFCGLLSRDYGS